MSRDQVLGDRLHRRWTDGLAALRHVYGDAGLHVAQRARDIVLAAAAQRSPELRRRDDRREAEPDWFLDACAIGYVCYVDRFADTLAGVRERLPYLEELGITYLHLMPLLRPRPGENDGGYAVMSYDEVDPALGTMGDLSSLASALHERGMSLCIDLVLNHTAREHDWAVRAATGDPVYRDFYRIFPDRTVPDQYEQTLREVFPDFKRGNFTALGDEWVWTTFHEYQWDLNYANPDVFCAMLDVICRLANRGVDVFRLDAAPFLWKRPGTDCENQPEAHHIVTALRAFVGAAAPSVIFKAEAIVAPDLLLAYLGAGLGADDPPRRECELAYHNQLMVLLWSSLATRDAALMESALRRMGPIPESTSWVTYLRCHDDIGWAIADADAAAVAWSGNAHRAFLSDYFSGRFAGSYASGDLFQLNPDTGDARISGTAASLCGIETAADDHQLRVALQRLELVYAVVFAYGGIPLLYMGDELGLVNDNSYVGDPARASDNRWMHRPRMDWSRAERRHMPGTIEHEIFARIRALAAARSRTPALGARGRTVVPASGDRRVFVLGHDRAGRREFLMLANFSDDTVDREVAESLELVHCGGGARFEDGSVHLPPLSYVWLAGVRVAGVRVAGVRVAGVRVAGVRVADVRVAEWHASSSDRP